MNYGIFCFKGFLNIKHFWLSSKILFLEKNWFKINDGQAYNEYLLRVIFYINLTPKGVKYA